MRSICSFALASSLLLSTAAFAADPVAPAPSSQKVDKCEAHGVKKALCTRCNPKLASIFKAKGDWCAEHDRPESQCSLCHPELAKEGIK